MANDIEDLSAVPAPNQSPIEMIIEIASPSVTKIANDLGIPTSSNPNVGSTVIVERADKSCLFPHACACIKPYFACSPANSLITPLYFSLP